MHSGMLANKRIEEQNKMIEEASAIGEALGIEGAADRLRFSPAGDPRLRQLYQDQALSGLLADIRKALGGEEQSESDGSLALEDVEGINDEIAAELRDRGINDGRDLMAASDDELLAVDGLGKSKLAKIREFLRG